MQVSALNSQDKSVNFQGIYSMSSAKFSKAQEIAVNAIRESLSKKSEVLNGLSADEFYKHNYSADFIITPLRKDYVRLELVTKLKKSNDFSDCLTNCSYKSAATVGKYNANTPVKLDDINKAARNCKISNITDYILILLATVIGAGLALITSGNRLKQESDKVVKPLIENVENSVKKPLSDLNTTKILKSFKI